jgi:hypothetical protein
LEHQNKELQDLKIAFLQHEAVCEERWRTIFNELREGKEESKERWAEVKVSVLHLHRLVWAGGGALILFLTGMIMKGQL